MKVVINACFGGFSISLEAGRFMAARGNKIAAAEVAEYDAKIADPSKLNSIEQQFGAKWYGYGYVNGSSGYERNDPDLVAAVEELGEKAGGEYSWLRIVEIPDGVSWHIDEYDGNEHIAEVHRTWR
jgi:hypothetical protein